MVVRIEALKLAIAKTSVKEQKVRGSMQLPHPSGRLRDKVLLTASSFASLLFETLDVGDTKVLQWARESNPLVT